MDFKDYFSRGAKLMREHNFDEALENFEAARELQPNNPDVLQAIESVKMGAFYSKKAAEALVDEAKSRASLGDRLYDLN